MYHVIFQVCPCETGYQTYLDTAARLRPHLDAIDGFLSVERFRSMERKHWILSLSKWADEQSLVKWRTLPEHRDAQQLGRNGVFDDYRLRVAQVATRALSATPQWNRERCTPLRTVGEPARLVSVLETVGLDCAALKPARDASDSELYESLVDRRKNAWIIGWNEEAAAHDWCSETCRTLGSMDGVAFELSLAELERDYGLLQRREAPQD